MLQVQHMWQNGVKKVTRIKFEEEKCTKCKYPDYHAYNIKSNEYLGKIIFYPQWSKFVWDQDPYIIMSQDCLQEVLDKIKEINEEMKLR